MSQTKTINTILNPIEWKDSPNTVLYGTVLRTTAYGIGATIKVTSADGSLLKTFKLDKNSGFESKYIGELTVPKFSDFPLTISSEITCDTDFDYASTPQVSLGLKSIGGNDIPVCYQSTLFCNDNLDNPNRDLDYNDFVLTWQLYNSSTD